MTRSNSTADWSRLMFDASRLWAEAGMVVALRSWRMMAGGPAANREFERMVGEKVEAGSELAGALAGGRVKVPRPPRARRSRSTGSTCAAIAAGWASPGSTAPTPHPAPAGTATGPPWRTAGPPATSPPARRSAMIARVADRQNRCSRW